MTTYTVLDNNIFGIAFARSSRLLTLVEESKKANTKLAIPEPVEFEVAARFKSDLSLAIQESNTAKRRLARLGIKNADRTIDVPAEHQTFMASMNDFIERNKIVRIPFPKAFKLQDFFIRAADKLPPFNSTASNFRDAVIWQAIAEFRPSHDDQIIFVTDDSEMRKLCKPIAPGWIRISSCDEALSQLQEMFGKEEAARQDRIKAGLLTSQKNFILAQLAEKLKTLSYEPTGGLDGLAETLVSLDDVKLTSDPDILAIFLEKADSINFTVRVRGELSYTITDAFFHNYRLNYPAPASFQAPEAIHDPLFSPAPQLQRKKVFNVTAQFKCRRTGDVFHDLSLVEIEHDLKPKQLNLTSYVYPLTNLE